MIAALLALALGASPGLPKERATEVPAPIRMTAVAVKIICSARGSTPTNYLAVPLERAKWVDVLGDGDLKPFVQAADKDSDGFVLLIPSKPDDDISYVVYFRKSVPATLASVRTGVASRPTVAGIRAAAKPVAKEQANSCPDALSFDVGNLTTDDGKPVPAFKLLPDRKDR